MFVIFAKPGQLIKENTPESLVLHQINKFKFWGGLSLILAVVLLVATLLADLTIIGVQVTVLYVALGVWLFTSRRFITIDIARQNVSFSTHFLLFKRTSRVIPFSQIDSVYLELQENGEWFIGKSFELEQGNTQPLIELLHGSHTPMELDLIVLALKESSFIA